MLESLKEIINPEVLLPICQDTLIAKECDRSATLKKLYIKNVPPHSIALTLDYKANGFSQLSPYLNKDNDIGINKTCDIVIITKRDEKILDIVLCDMKSEKPRRKKTILQLRNSEQYIRYVLELLKEFYKISTQEIFVYRIVTSNNRNISKKPTYPKNSMLTNEPFTSKNVEVSNKGDAHISYASLKG